MSEHNTGPGRPRRRGRVFKTVTSIRTDLPWDICSRISERGEREGPQFMSPEDQEKLGRNGGAAHGVKVGRVHTDVDEKSVNFSRPGLDLALRRLEEGVIAGIIFPYIARAGRLTRENIDLVLHIQELGGQVIFAQENLTLATDNEWAMFQMMCVWAEMQWRQGRASALRFRETRISEGRAGHTCFGYRISKEPFEYRLPDGTLRDYPAGALRPIDELVPVVQDIFQQRADGVGPSDIAKSLNVRGIVTRVRTRRDGSPGTGGNAWSDTAVDQLLQRRTYLGELTIRAACDEHHPRKNGCAACEQEPVLHKAASHPPLVSSALWHAANLRRTPRGRNAGSAPHLDTGFLCAGYVRCAGCGYMMRSIPTHNGARGSYACQHDGCPEPAGVSYSLLDPYVESHLLSWWELQERHFVPRSDDEELGLMRDELAELRRLRDKVHQNRRHKADNYDDWAATVAAFDGDIAELQDRVTVRAADHASVPPVRVRTEWQERRLSMHDKRRSLGQTVGTILVARAHPSDATGLVGAMPPDGKKWRLLSQRVLLLNLVDLAEGGYSRLFPHHGYGPGTGQLFRWAVDEKTSRVTLLHRPREGGGEALALAG